MTSPVSAWFSMPIIVLMALTLAVRFAFLNTSTIDRLTTQALAFGWVGLVLRERSVQDLIGQIPKPLGDVALYQQLTFGCIVMIVQAIYGMSRLWDGVDPDTVRKRQKNYYAIGLALSAVIMVAGTPSRKAGQLIDQFLGWPAVVLWTAFYAPILVVSVIVARIFIRELREPDTTPRERALYGLTIFIAAVLALDGAATPLLTVNEVVTGSGSADPEMHVKSLTFFGAVVGSMVIGAVPVIAVLRARLGRDRISKNLKEIESMWRDLVTEFPDVQRTDEEVTDGPAHQLHRKIIEIHDALLRLSRWNPVVDADRTADVQVDADGLAAEMASAYKAKIAGVAPAERYELLKAISQHSEGQDLTAASDELVKVAQSWRKFRPRHARIS